MFMSVIPRRNSSGRRSPACNSASRIGAGLVAAVAVALTVGACGSDDADSTGVEPSPASTPDPATSTTPDPSTSTTPDPSVPAPPTTVAPGPDDLGPTAQRLVDVAASDLVERLDLDATSAEIEVVSVEEVTWRDSSLGCPVKDMQYTQVLTPGTRIVLRHDGVTFDYHAGAGRDPFYCARPEAPLPDA